MTIRFRTFACVVIGVSAATMSLASAGEYVVAGAVHRIADRCATQFGEGFVDSGDGVCARHTRPHTRVYVSPSSMGDWSHGGTSNAAVTSTDRTSIVPGVPTQRLRVRGNLDSYSPFR